MDSSNNSCIMYKRNLGGPHSSDRAENAIKKNIMKKIICSAVLICFTQVDS